MSNRLTALAADIRAAHDEITQANRACAERAVDIGKWLYEAKSDEGIPRGGWRKWVETVAGLPVRTADHYIKLFIAVDEGLATLPVIAEVGQKAALKAIFDWVEEDGPETDTSVWTEDQMERKAQAEAGKCVVANIREGFDIALLAWATTTERLVRIDRKTDWGNPFEMPDDGERAEVIGKFSKFYLPYKDGLLARIPTLRGKVLGCWCHPEECHGHIIAEIVNREADGDGTPGYLADQLAEIDG